MATLYELSSAYIRLLEMAQDPETSDTVIYDTMEAIDGELEDKAESYAVVIKELTARINAIDAEIERLEAMKRACSDNILRMKGRLQSAMESTGKMKFKTTLFSFNIQKNPPSVAIDAKSWRDIPKDYLKYRDPEIDRAKMKKDIQDGKDLTGIAHLTQTESLRIR